MAGFTDVELLYFNIQGKGEPIRLLLSYAGIPFKDSRFASRDEFVKAKESGLLRFGQVPALKVTDAAGKTSVLNQSWSIMRFIGKIASPELELYPTDPVQAQIVDSIGDQEADSFAGVRVTKYRARFGFGELEKEENAELLAKVKKDLLQSVVPRHLASLSAQLSANKSDWLAGTSKPSICDFFWAPVLKTLDEWLEMEDTLTSYPNLVQLTERFYALPAVQEYYNKIGEDGGPTKKQKV